MGRYVGSNVNDGLRSIGMSLSGTFFGGSDVNFIVLESHDLALAPGKEPGGVADTSGLEEESGLEEDVNNRVAQESNGEAGSNQLPCDGSKDGGGNGSHETQIEHLLDLIRNTEDVLVYSDDNVDGGNTGDNEEAQGDSHLTTAHESREVTSSILEQTFASAEGHKGGSTFGLGELGDGEESNLHSLKKTDTAHEDEEQKERDSLRNSIPGRGLSTVESINGNTKGKSKNSEGEEDTEPEEGEGDSSLRRFVGFDRLSCGPVSHHTDQVGSVHDTGNFDSGSNPISEGHEMGVDVVKHHVGCVTLRSQLSNNNVLQNHGNTGSEEDGRDPVGKSEDLGSRERGSAKTDGEVDEDNHELTSHEVSVKVVSLVSPSGDLVGDGVGFTVEFTVDRRKTDHGALSSFNHRHPDDKGPHDNSSSDRMNVTGELSVSGSNQRQDNDDGEHQKEKGDDNTDLVQGGVDSVRFIIDGHVDSCFQSKLRLLLLLLLFCLVRSCCFSGL
mmetsp:Transcript_8280/g.24476  ORF Transcript_8280/g.24476 Transcript_8280/m.24476 type:complete len:499 (-) Transcript_8280:39-1535(-)